MPYFMEFSPAVGVRAGYLPGYFASQGCWWMPRDLAALFFERVQVGTPVTVVGSTDKRARVRKALPILPRMFMAPHMEDRYPIVDILEQTPSIPDNCQWAIFLRNHDELTLEMVTEEERDYMYRVYA